MADMAGAQVALTARGWVESALPRVGQDLSPTSQEAISALLRDEADDAAAAWLLDSIIGTGRLDAAFCAEATALLKLGQFGRSEAYVRDLLALQP